VIEVLVPVVVVDVAPMFFTNAICAKAGEPNNTADSARMVDASK